MTNFDRQRADIDRLTNAAATAVEGWATENQLALSGCTLATETRMIARATIAYLIGEQLIVSASAGSFDEVSGYIDRVHEADLDAALARELAEQDRIDAAEARRGQDIPLDARRAFLCGGGC